MTEKIATREAYGKTLAELGASHPDLVVLDADLSCSTKTNIFAKKFPDRFFNVGVAEQNLMGWAAGLSLAGKVPFASTFAVFASGRAFDQVRNSISFSNLNVKIGASHAGLSVGPDGASHQAVEDLALMRTLPNFTVLVPADGPQAAQMTRWAYEHKGPVYLRLGRPAVASLPALEPITIGLAQQLEDGREATIIACGTMLQEALQAAASLRQAGITVRVLNLHTLKPLDTAAIVKAAKETRAIVTVEEHSIYGGLGSSVAEVLAESGSRVLFQRLGVKDRFGESGESEELFDKFGLSAPHIAAAVRGLLKL